jgi:hypothetical protein
MSFIYPTEEKIIKTSDGKTFKMFITQQQGDFWVATVLYTKNGEVCTHYISDIDKSESYRKASEWVLNNIDDKAVIDLL